jgi:hypothetical protein
VKYVFVRRGAVHFNLQVARAASLQKRQSTTDLINGPLAFVTQVIQQILGFGNEAFAQTASLMAGLQATAATILTQVTKYPICATAQTANVHVASTLLQTGMVLHQLY